MTREDLSGLTLEDELRGKLLNLVKRSASEERFIEFVNSSLVGGRLDFKSLEIILDLTLAAVDQYGYVDFSYFGHQPAAHNQQPFARRGFQDSQEAAAPSDRTVNVESRLTLAEIDAEFEARVPDLSSYDGDDEELDDTFIFPCHVVYDDCHPELLTDYHREHLKPSRNPIQIIKLPKVCEFVFETLFDNLRYYISRQADEAKSNSRDRSVSDHDDNDDDDEGDDSGLRNAADESHVRSASSTPSLASLLTMAVRLVKKINRVCLNERRNCRILSRTGILGVLLENAHHLIDVLPDEQHIYLEPLIKFAFTLSDYKISGANLKQLFKIIKHEEANLGVVLKNLNGLLEHHFRILRNIQPSKSINFPTASRTPEEIEYNRYLANSWHWRLRSKVIEHKRRRSRTDSQSQDLKAQLAQLKKTKRQEGELQEEGETASTRMPRFQPVSSSNTSSSWLECTLMTPLSNISPLIHSNGEMKLCCSLWLSVCGDLLVIEATSNKSPIRRNGQRRGIRATGDQRGGASGRTSGLHIDWTAANGHWLRLTSRRRLVRRHKNKLALSLKPRKRRLSAKIRARQAYDQEDEERDEKEERARKSDAELTQGHSRSGRGFKLFHSSLRQQPGLGVNHSLDKQQQQQQQQPGNGTTNGATPEAAQWRDHSQEQLIHMISFAFDSLTIEIWLNVKCMSFYARTCRVTREGQTDVHDGATFRSHLKANGSWSNVIFCLEEEPEQAGMKAVNLKLIVNGIHEELVRLVFSAHKSPLTNFALLIGCERSTFGYVWKLSQVNLYKNIPDANMPIFLLGKGPDFWSFTNFRQQSQLPLPDVTQRNTKLLVQSPEVLAKYGAVDEDQAMNWLTQNIVISYVAHQPEHFLDYSPSMTGATLMSPLPADFEFSNSAERFIQAKTLDFSRAIKFNQNNGFGCALVEAGGIESVLMSFAEVVRRPHTDAQQTHALAFSVLLKMVQSNSYHLSKFLDELNGLKLVEYILAHPKCQVSCEMLESYLDFCLIVHKQQEDSHRPLIKSPKLIYHLLTCWRVWHKEARVAKTLYRRLIKLLHTTAPQIHRRQGDLDQLYIDHNFRMISQAGGVDILMDILRDCLMSADATPKPPFIDHELIDQIVHLISLLINQPPGLDVTLDIMEFLLFLHPDPKAFVEISRDKIGYLEQLGSAQANNARIVFDDDDDRPSSRVRTPSSESEDSELDFSSDEELARNNGQRMGANSYSSSGDGVSADSSAANRISNQCSRNLAEILEQYNRCKSGNKSTGEKWTHTNRNRNGFLRASGGGISNPNCDQSSSSSSVLESAACCNRNYAIAKIADMLHFIIILPLSHSHSANRTLAEALQKLILDPRKFIILANNDLPMVREKVLRLFLHFIRACYKSNLRSVVANYDRETESPNYRICSPIHLMARQLLRYRTTNRMIQLCHGILGGVTDFEAADTFFTSFEIDTNNIQFQLNILVLLIQLLTKLPDTSGVIAGLRVVHAYMKELLRIGEELTVSVIIKNDLVDCLMSLYFAHVKKTVEAAQRGHPTTDEEEEEEEAEVEDNSETRNDDSLLFELDRLLIFVVRFHLQTKSTNALVNSICDLVLYLELLSSRTPAQFKYLLRDRMVKIFLTKLRFCSHYEDCARQRAYNGKLQYYLKSLLKNSELNKFSNVLPEFGPADLTGDGADWPPRSNADLHDSTRDRSEQAGVNFVESSGNGTSIDTAAGENDIQQQQRQRVDSLSGSPIAGMNGRTPSPNEEHHLSSANSQAQHEITESSVIDRFKATFALISNFVTTREPEVIPSPLERSFIMNCLKTLARYLLEIDNRRNTLGRPARQTTQWSLILAKMKHLMRALFTRLILYLLSPTSDSMNLDERKYFAHQILDMFNVEQLLSMLADGSSRSNHKILLVFIKDLMDYEPNQGEIIYSEELGGSANHSEEELLDDTEIKLRELICVLESEVGSVDLGRNGTSFEAGLNVGGNRWWSGATSGPVEENGDQKYRAIWLEDLAKAREDFCERVEFFASQLRLAGVTSDANNKQSVAGSSLDNLTLIASDERDRFLDEAVSITKDVVNDKHEQRKAYLEEVKQGKIYNYHIRQQWLSLIIGHTHERAIWFLEDYYPKSWELNPVEGPSRTRRRLRPCKLKLEPRFLRSGPPEERNLSQRLSSESSGGPKTSSRLNRSSSGSDDDDEDDDDDDWHSLYSPHPLCSLILNNEQSLDSNELRIRMFTTDKIHFNCDCSIIRPNEVCHGEVSIASWCIHFIGNRSEGDGNCGSALLTSKHLRGRLGTSARSTPTNKAARGLSRNSNNNTIGSCAQFSTDRDSFITTTVVEDLWFDEIVEIWDRRYQLQEVGLEIFLTNNMTYLLSFRTNADREDFKQNLMREQHKMINLQRFNLTSSLSRLTQLWRDGKLTNFDYLTCLNKLAGRSFNDLMQYPVFPFVLSNYVADTLNLNDANNFRNLKRPMAIQNEEREANFKNVYQMSSSSSGPTAIGSFGFAKPYHYGNHYSNSATVLHFLVRLPPFTQMLIEYQDNNFDQPDRTFHAMANTWQLITRDSNTDFKELIPEFFFLPEMFINIGDLELGRKQNNELVDDVKLPAWCPNSDARLFTLIHRQALESAFVSGNLHHWIDLIFGYKQTGKAAIEALNVFHPATYYGGIDFGKEQRNASSTSSGYSDSMSTINLTIVSRTAKSSIFGSVAGSHQTGLHQGSGWNSAGEQNDSQQQHSPRRQALNKFLQADIERSALETMIKTYGQMPRQLFSSPMKQRSASSFAKQLNENHLEKQQADQSGSQTLKLSPKKLEPLKHVKGLRWGSYVGSPSDNDIIAVKHKRIIMEPVKTNHRIKKDRKTDEAGVAEPKLLSKQSDKFHFCLLANGDVAMLRNNTSLMLDYRADRKSSGTYQLSVPSARYSRRAGLSRVSRMNLFSNMIISRQQFSFLEPVHAPSNQFNSDGAAATAANQSSSLVATLTGSAANRAKFSLDSLNLVSWFYIDGVVRVKHPAPSNQKPSIPLVQANTIVDTMTTCCSVPELNLLLVGYRSGSICAHIVSTAYETVPLQQQNTSTTLMTPNLSAGPSAVHFLNASSSGSATMDASLLGPGRVIEKSSGGEPYTPVSLAGKTLQSVRSMNKTSRWLYCHEKRVNCIKINVSFGIVVTGSDDGTSVIWDLNSLTFVRTIDYKLSSLRVRKEQSGTKLAASGSPKSSRSEHYLTWTYGRAHKQKLYDYLCTCNQPNTELTNESLGDDEPATNRPHDKSCQCFICGSGVSLIAISDTLGDIVTIKHLNNRLAAASEPIATNTHLYQDQISSEQAGSGGTSRASAASLNSHTGSTGSSSESTLTSVIYVHTINGALVNFANCHAQVTAVNYSNAPEGISINVIVVGMIDGLVRLYSSWDLSRVKEFRVSGLESPISDIMYTRASQLLYVAYEDGQMVVLRNKKKGSISLPKEWIL